MAVVGLGLAGWALTAPAPPRAERSSLRAACRAMAGRPVALAFWLAMLPSLYSGALVVLAPLRLDVLGAGGLAIGGVFLVAAIFEGSLSALVGRISDRRGRLLPIRVGLAGAAMLAVLLPVLCSRTLAAVLAHGPRRRGPPKRCGPGQPQFGQAAVPRAR